jgi:hypothetical protein
VRRSRLPAGEATMRARLIALPGPVWTMLLWASGALLNALALGLWFSPAPGFTGWIVQVVFQVVVIVVLLTLGARRRPGCCT